MNDETLEQNLRKLPPPVLPAAWRAEIISQALREVSTTAVSRSVWPTLLLYLRGMVLRNPITSGAMAALWLLILSLKLSTPVDPASVRMLLVHIDPGHPLHIVSIQDQIRLVLLAQEQPEPRQIP